MEHRRAAAAEPVHGRVAGALGGRHRGGEAGGERVELAERDEPPRDAQPHRLLSSPALARSSSACVSASANAGRSGKPSV